MALNNIITKIAKDAEEEATAIAIEADKEAVKVRAEGEAALKAFEEEATATIERAAKKASEQVLAAARHQASFTQAESRNKHINAMFEAVRKKLTSLSPSDYQAFMKKLLKDIPKEAEFIIAKEREDETKKVLKELGAKTNDIKVAPAGELLGGCIVTTKDSEYNFSFSGMLRDLERTQRARAAQELFKN